MHIFTSVKETGLIDYDTLEEKAGSTNRNLILRRFAYSRDWDYARIRKSG
jgi:glycine/serine hydroxymethyltransferase